MSITAYSTVRTGLATTVTATSSLSGTVYYHWFQDGAYLGVSTTPSKAFALAPGDQSRIEAVDTNDPDYDPLFNPPAGYPARRTITWIRSLDEDVARYRIEQYKGLEVTPEATFYVLHESAKWLYLWLSGRLNDLTNYYWTVTPVDAAGNDGTIIQMDSQRVVRTPDSPTFTATFDAGTTRVAFA